MTGTMLLWSTMINSNYYSQIAESLPQFVAVVDEYEYNSATVEQIIALSDTSLLQGIIVLNHTASSEATLSYTSPAPVYPRDSEYAWNPKGDGLMLKDMYGVPTGYVSDDEIAEYIYTVSQQQATALVSALSDEKSGIFDSGSKRLPPVMAEFNLYMGPREMDSKKCLSWIDTDGVWRPKCLPIGGNSVWALAGSPYERGSNGNDAAGEANAERRAADKQPIVIVGTNMDATSMFHDEVRGANTAASNILTVLMAAKIFGQSVTDTQLDALQNKVMFAFFEGENYGYIGSRSFLRDVAGFECDSSAVPAVAKNKDSDNVKMACLSPLRHELDFMDLGEIQSMIAVDQVGILNDDNTFYVHSSNDNGGYSDILVDMTSDDWPVTAASAGSLPPTPLTSLVSISGVGGVVIAGYDDAFADGSFYLSHMDSTEIVTINLEAVAKAATLVARTALAAAYGDNYYAGSAADTIAELESDDETLTELANCLFTNGNCKMLQNYANMERLNTQDESGVDVGTGRSLGKPPNYYPSVFISRGEGQAFVQLDGVVYGAYTGEKEYGSNSNDLFLLQPNTLTMSLHGLLNDYLGRGGSDSNGDTPEELQTCQKPSDCSSITYCSNAGDKAVCTGSNYCVCSRAHYHIALDQAIIPSPNNSTGYFMVSDDDDGTSLMYTEPNWDNDIGVQVYRATEGSANWTLFIGAAATISCISATLFMNRRLRKEKLY